MTTNLFLNRTRWLHSAFCTLILLFSLGVGNAWGADETLTINSSCSWGSGDGYKTNSGSFQTNASSSVNFSWTKVMNSSSCVQMAKSSEGGELHSTSSPSSNPIIKSINLTVATNTVNLYGRASDSDDWASITYTSGTAKNILASGYKYFKVESDSKYTQITSIIVVYTTSAPASKYTVSFNTGAGNPSQSDITEATAGAGVTLPSVTPTCSGDGWALYGWATSACGSETSTAPTIVGKPGDTYKPESNITLYAVYAKGEYTKETSSITSGSKYLIVGASGGHNYIMKSSSDDMHDYSGYTGMAATQIDETSSGKYHAAAVDASWCYTISGSVGAYYIRDVVNESSSNYLDLYFTSFWGKSYYSEDSYTMTVSSGEWTIKHNDASNTYLGLDGSDEAFFNYSSAQNILLYKAGTIKYWSSPTCASCDNDPTVTAASNNGSFL